MPNTKSNKSLYGVRRQISQVPTQSYGKRNEIKKARSEAAAANAAVDYLVVVPPDGGWGWVVVVAVFVCNFFIDGTQYGFGIFLEEIATSVDSTTTHVALANSVMTGFYYLIAPFVGAVINRCGYRVVTVIGCLVASMSTLATSFCNDVVYIIFIYGVIGGTSFGTIYLASTIVVGFYFEKWRPLAQSIAVCGSSLGTTCFPLMFSILIENEHWRTKFRILSTAFLLCTFCGLLYRPLHPVKVVTADDKKVQFVSDTASGKNESGVRGMISRYHNTGYPTTAEIYGRSTVTLAEPSYAVFAAGGVPSSSVSKAGKLSSVNEDQSESKCQRCCGTCQVCCARFSCRSPYQQAPSRPLYRDDIFYSGSVLQLAEYSRHASNILRQSAERIIDYHLSVTRIATQKDLEQHFEVCICCPEAVKRTLATMLDLSILKSPSFLLLSISGFFTTLGLYTPFMFVVERAKARGMKHNLAYQLLSGLGIANTVGRIMSGVLSSLPNVKALLFSCICLGICGISVIVSSFYSSTTSEYVFVAFFGGTIACVAALRPIIVVDMLGLERLTNGFGITLVFQGIACLIGVPLAARFKEMTGAYDLSFHFAGGVITASAIMLVPIGKLSNWEKRKQTQNELEQAAKMKANK